MQISAISWTWRYTDEFGKRKWRILFYAERFALLATNRKNKGDRTWAWPGVITGRFGNKYALVRRRGSYIEADLDDMRSANRSFGILGRDGALQLHLPSTKFPIHYMFGSQTLISLSKMRNVILNRNQTTWGKYGHSLDTAGILPTAH